MIGVVEDDDLFYDNEKTSLNGNMGYLFEVDPRLAKVFLEGAEAANPKDEAFMKIRKKYKK